jgi:hypothetical protein
MATKRKSTLSDSRLHDETTEGRPGGQRGANKKGAASPTDELPLDFWKRVVSRALWSQEYFWTIASLCVAVDALLTTIIVLAVACK